MKLYTGAMGFMELNIELSEDFTFNFVIEYLFKFAVPAM